MEGEVDFCCLGESSFVSTAFGLFLLGFAKKTLG